MNLGYATSEELVTELLRRTGCDLNSDGMKETPRRYIKALMEWTYGQRLTPPEVKVFEGGDYNEMIFIGKIPFWSLCEHHIAPFWGLAHIGYIPQNGRIVGLSKVPRIVDYYSKRATMQERITMQIAEHLKAALDPLGIGVVLQARHTCIESRGVCKSGCITQTNALLDVFRSQGDVRLEFLANIKSETI